MLQPFQPSTYKPRHQPAAGEQGAACEAKKHVTAYFFALYVVMACFEAAYDAATAAPPASGGNSIHATATACAQRKHLTHNLFELFDFACRHTMARFTFNLCAVALMCLLSISHGQNTTTTTPATPLAGKCPSTREDVQPASHRQYPKAAAAHVWPAPTCMGCWLYR